MIDYRSFVESKLGDIEKRRKALEAERERLITALDVLNEADASGEPARPVETTTPDPPPVTEAIVSILKSSGQMMTADEVYESLLKDYKALRRDLMYSGFYRLRKRGAAFKDGKKWGLVGRDDATVASTDQGQSTPTITNPTGHQLQPSLSHAVVQA